jgi:glycolate oxidase FAD binding subunit
MASTDGGHALDVPPRTIAGLTPGATARPGSVPELVDLLRSTSVSHPAVTVIGSGSKQHLGHPPRALDLAIDTRGLSGVVEYNPGDLVIRVRAGTSTGELREVAGEHGQQLALDFGDDETAGGVVAANLGGARRRRYGAVRDLLIGVQFVLADGRIANSGGRVVKNVAGYDLAKLMTGSLGTLAVLVELTFRLHPGPGHRAVLELDADRAALGDLAAWALRTQHDLAALDYRADLAGRGSVVAVVEGPEAAVAATTERLLTELAGARERAPGPDELRTRVGLAAYPDASGTAENGGALDGFVLRIACAPSGLPAMVDQLAQLDALTGQQCWQLGLGLGTVRLRGPRAQLTAALARLRTAAAAADGTVVVTDATPGVRAQLDLWGPLRGAALMQATKNRFDPAGRLAPGRLLGGAT